jgi:hypothetical protein
VGKSPAIATAASLAEFGQLGDEGGGDDRPNAGSGAQSPITGCELEVGRHQLGHPRLDLDDATVKQDDDAADVGARIGSVVCCKRVTSCLRISTSRRRRVACA